MFVYLLLAIVWFGQDIKKNRELFALARGSGNNPSYKQESPR